MGVGDRKSKPLAALGFSQRRIARTFCPLETNSTRGTVDLRLEAVYLQRTLRLEGETRC